MFARTNKFSAEKALNNGIHFFYLDKIPTKCLSAQMNFQAQKAEKMPIILSNQISYGFSIGRVRAALGTYIRT